MSDRRQKLYETYLAVPDHQRAEIVGGTLYVSQRSAPRNAHARTMLMSALHSFQQARGGGWWLLSSEVQLVPLEPLQPSFAGWRTRRMPELPDASHITVVPDWIADVVHPWVATREKLALFARHGVAHVWLVDPNSKSLEVYSLDDESRWREVRRYEGNVRVRAAPFDTKEIDLAALWI